MATSNIFLVHFRLRSQNKTEEMLAIKGVHSTVLKASVAEAKMLARAIEAPLYRWQYEYLGTEPLDAARNIQTGLAEALSEAGWFPDQDHRGVVPKGFELMYGG